jgi:hypothetical protein
MGRRQFDRIPSADAERSSTHRARAPEPQVSRSVGGGRLAWVGAALLRLQRDRGNRYVQQVIGGARAVPALQAKLAVGPPDDEHEREADHLARQVLRLAAGLQQGGGGADRAGVGAKTRRPGGARTARVAEDLERRLHDACASGRPLPAPLRAQLETAFGADFARVRVHTDDQAVTLSRDLQAQAFTSGPDVFFGAGRYAPGTPAGRGLLAHELTHVVQQGWARPRPERAFGGAETTPAIRTSRGDATSSGGAEPVQRKLSWQHTDWPKATEAHSSAGGARGAVFVTDDPKDDPVVVKSGEDAPAEVVLAANVHRLGQGGAGAWRVDAPGVRAVDRREGGQIKWLVRALLDKNDTKGLTIVNDADKPGTMVFEYAGGMEFKDLMAQYQKHSEPKTIGRRLRNDSPLRLFKDPAFVQSLGRFTAVDIFTGNYDRLAGMYNAENFKVDKVSQTILLIDNVLMSDVFAFRTFKNAKFTLTSDYAYNEWVKRSWTKKLRADEFERIAGDVLDTVKQGIGSSVRQEDVEAVNKALDKAKSWLAMGLRDGKALLHAIVGKGMVAQLTTGMAPEDVDDVEASIKRRLAHLMGY